MKHDLMPKAFARSDAVWAFEARLKAPPNSTSSGRSWNLTVVTWKGISKADSDLLLD
jgi:hypothetical protein